MINTYTKSMVDGLLADAGIQLNGTHPWDLQVHNDALYSRVLRHLDLGLGEAYMDGWFDCSKLDEFFYRILNAKLEDKVLSNKKLFLTLLFAKFWGYKNKLFNYQTPSRAFEIGEKHYDHGNDLFEAMLDKKMTYTCGYWRDAKTLDEAQTNKLKLTCDKLYLKPGMTLLDIGCGWGSLAKYAAENYGVSVIGITVSKEQTELARERCKGLPVEIRLQDYRDVTEKFDRIASLGMFEHVGRKNYRTYMEVANRCLKDDGLFLLHTIGLGTATTGASRWINKYIFPNSMLPSLKQINAASEDIFTVEDVHNFGADYDKTLMAWHKNFNDHWDELKSNYNERFFRMWNYYLLSCAALFRVRHTQLWQIVLSKHGIPRSYESIR
ncbi:MAG: cyclopropane fatty acyl phospholipid synthase [Pseudomonadota bacterium]